MLAKAVSDRWRKEDSNEPIFFDRDGQRFKYVLDYLRDDKVNLPVGETKETFNTELEYFGIDIDPDSITSDEDVTLISFQQRFESHISRIEKNLKTRQRDYIVYRIGLDVYKEAENEMQNSVPQVIAILILRFHILKLTMRQFMMSSMRLNSKM